MTGDGKYRQLVLNYFQRLFGERDLTVIDEYLDKAYRDSDISPDLTDHLRNSKDYLTTLFQKYPSIRVRVGQSLEHDNALSTFLEWYLDDGSIIRKGIASFSFSEKDKIMNRTTLIYFDKML